VTSLPAISILVMAWGNANPSYTGTTWLTPSPESSTTPVVLPDAYRLRIAYHGCKEQCSRMRYLPLYVVNRVSLLYLRGDKDGWYIECLEEHLRSLFSVGIRIQRGFCQQHLPPYNHDKRSNQTNPLMVVVTKGKLLLSFFLFFLPGALRKGYSIALVNRHGPTPYQSHQLSSPLPHHAPSDNLTGRHHDVPSPCYPQNCHPHNIGHDHGSGINTTTRMAKMPMIKV